MAVSTNATVRNGSISPTHQCKGLTLVNKGWTGFNVRIMGNTVNIRFLSIYSLLLKNKNEATDFGIKEVIVSLVDKMVNHLKT